MSEWARREMELKCERSNNFKELNDACLAAFDAYVSLHKNITRKKHIDYAMIMLERLLEKKPLTPISEEDEWNCLGHREDDNNKIYKLYVCERYSSLRKCEYEDGTVKYSDLDRVVGVDVGDPENEFNCLVLTNLVDEVLPIRLPYYPLMEKHKVYCETITLLQYPSAIRKFDFLAVKAIVEPGIEGSYVDINRYFYFPSDYEVIEISKEDFDKNKNL